MELQQPQLLQVALDKKDVVFTPDWVARDMVDFFKPSGRILEPCKGDGVFLKYLPPQTEWCEISEGKDFYAWNESVDWVFGNPPWGQFWKWFNHSMAIANNICYVLPTYKIFNAYRTIKAIYKWGAVEQIRIYGTANSLFSVQYGYSVAAFLVVNGSTKPARFSFATPHLTNHSSGIANLGS